MNLPRVAGAAALGAAQLLAACAGKIPETPPPLDAGEHTCARCGMLLTDVRFGAAARQAGAREFTYFDDTGCFLEWREESGDVGPLEVWVQDYEGKGWLSAPQAFYVVGPTVGSPMAYGIAAFGDEAAARRFAREHDATWIRFEELRSRVSNGEDHDDQP